MKETEEEVNACRRIALGPPIHRIDGALEVDATLVETPHRKDGYRTDCVARSLGRATPRRCCVKRLPPDSFGTAGADQDDVVDAAGEYLIRSWHRRGLSVTIALPQSICP